MSKNFDCRVKNWSSTLQEVPVHKKEVKETNEESNMADNASRETLEVEISKQGYNRVVQITDSKRDHADMFTDKEHEKKDDEGKDAHISNITRTNKQSNDAYIGITAKIRNKDQNPKISEDDKAGNSQASKNPLNTTKAKDYKDANINGTEDGTEENPNPPSTLGVNNSITKIRLEVENNNFVKANGKRILKNTASSTSIRELLN